ncbi:hypothetical protein AKO1_010688 [Acrasis kona]|uniref:Tripartite motif-containing protein 3 n=1 Tax=Acrasis kona TaxID=1008807 RepID=A0AAW2ZK78_9EUKA
MAQVQQRSDIVTTTNQSGIGTTKNTTLDPVHTTVQAEAVTQAVTQRRIVETQNRQVIREIIVEPIYEIERRIEYVYVPMPPGTEIYRELPAQTRGTITFKEAPYIAATSSTLGNVTSLPQVFVKQICASGKRDLWGLTNDGMVYRLNDNAMFEAFRTPKNHIPFSDISVIKRAIFGIGRQDGLLYLLNTNNETYETVVDDTTPLQSISALSPKRVYAVARDGRVLHLEIGSRHSIWEPLGTIPMKKVAVGSKHLIRHNEVWGIGLDDSVYRYDRNVWTQLPFKVADLSVGVDNSVFGVTHDGRLHRFDNGNFSFLDRPFRDQNNNGMDVHLGSVSVYKQNKVVYGIDKNSGNLLRTHF